VRILGLILGAAAVLVGLGAWLLPEPLGQRGNPLTPDLGALSVPSSVSPEDALEIAYLEDGFWDADGQRTGIAVRDGFSPWADGVSFNLINNNYIPGMADMRKFASVVIVGKQSGWRHSVSVTPGDVIEVKASIMNTADPDLLFNSPDERGVAVQTRLVFGYHTTSGSGGYVYAVVGADNASPDWVASSIALVSARPIRLEPIPESARLHIGDPRQALELDDSGLFADSRVRDAGNLVRIGALIGSSGFDGRVDLWPDGFIEVTVRFTVTAAG